MGSDALVSVRDLKIHYLAGGSGAVRRILDLVATALKPKQLSRERDHGRRTAQRLDGAVDGVSFEIGRGATLRLVGESGCGKSSVGRALVRLLKPTARQVLFEDRDLARLSAREMCAAVRLRIREMRARLSIRNRQLEIYNRLRRPLVVAFAPVALTRSPSAAK